MACLYSTPRVNPQDLLVPIVILQQRGKEKAAGEAEEGKKWEIEEDDDVLRRRKIKQRLMKIDQ